MSQASRLPSDVRTKAPFRVPTSTRTPLMRTPLDALQYVSPIRTEVLARDALQWVMLRRARTRPEFRSSCRCPLLDLLDEPGVPIRVRERAERVVVTSVRVRTRLLVPRLEMEDLARACAFL